MLDYFGTNVPEKALFLVSVRSFYLLYILLLDLQNLANPLFGQI